MKDVINQEPSVEQLRPIINYQVEEQPKAALALSNKLLGQFPNSVMLLNLLGASYTGINDFEAAVYHYKRALTIDSDHANTYFNMANTQKQMGELEAATESYKQVIKINPNDAEAYNNMGITQQSSGFLEAAIHSYQEALKISPNFSEAHNNLGAVLNEKGDIDAAIDSYKKACQINPNYAEAYNNMGLSFNKKYNLKASIKCYKQAISIKPDYEDALHNLAIALYKNGDREEAEGSYAQAGKIKHDVALNAQKKHLMSSLNGTMSHNAPRAYVESLFDNYASNFDDALVDGLGYKIPQILTEVILKKYPEESLGSILDLGCGTGLVGQEIKGYTEKLEGIDLSKLMLLKATKKKIYDKLTHCDLIDYLSTRNLAFDFFIAADVFVYIGQLDDVFRLIKTRNIGSGKLVFSTEHIIKKEGFSLEESGRYSHSKKYIEALSRKFGYKIVYFSIVNLRKDKKSFIKGGIYILEF